MINEVIRMLKIMDRIRFRLFIAVLSAMFLSCMSILTSEALSRLITEIAEAGIQDAFHIAFEIAGLFVLQLYCAYLVHRKNQTVLKNVAYEYLYSSLSNKINSIEYDNHWIRSQGDFLTLVQTDVEKTAVLFSDTLPEIILQTLQIVIIMFYICMKSVSLSAVYIMSLFLCIFAQMKSGTLIQKAEQKNKQSQIVMNHALTDVLTHRRMLKLNHASQYTEDIYRPKQEEYADDTVAVAKIMMPLKGIGYICGILPILVLCAAGVYLICEDCITLSVFVTVYYLCQTIVTDQIHYSDLIASAVSIRVSLSRILDFLNEKDAERIISADKGIHFTNVSYCYPGSNYEVLKDITLDISPGLNVALIGDSGSGKSTLLKLVAGVISPCSGSAVAEKAILVQQFPYVFDGTVRDNITGFYEVEENRYRQAISDAGVLSFCDEPSDDHVASAADASSLSAGQKQRTAIARGLYHGEKLMLFDESFSALDAMTADTVIRNVLRHDDETTVVMTLHQTEFLPLMDRIIVLKHGAILFDGSYSSYCAWKKITYEEK